MWTSGKFHTQEISIKDEISQGFFQKCTKYRPLEKFHTQKISMKNQTSQEFHRNLLSVDLWNIPYSENHDVGSNFSKVSSKYTKCEPLKNSTFRKHRWKSELLKSYHENLLSVDLWKFHFQKISMKDQISQEFHRNVLSIDLWKIPHLENIDERPNFSRVSSWMYSSVDLWKIPHLENIDERPNSSRVSSKMY